MTLDSLGNRSSKVKILDHENRVETGEAKASALGHFRYTTKYYSLKITVLPWRWV